MLMVSNAYAAVSIADEPPSSGATSPPAAAQSSGEQTLARFDKNHPLKIGAQYYPPESKRLGEKGMSLVRVQVDGDGRIRP
jgi:hypothetical protein